MILKDLKKELEKFDDNLKTKVAIAKDGTYIVKELNTVFKNGDEIIILYGRDD